MWVSVGRCRYRCWVLGAATAGISAAMLGILAANILKDVSDHCCQGWLGWAGLGGCSGRDKPISPIVQGSWAPGLGWAGLGWRGRAEAGARCGAGTVPARRCRHRLSRVHPASRAALCARHHRSTARGHGNRSLSSHSLITSASPQPHRRRYRHLTPPPLLSSPQTLGGGDYR